MFHETNGRHMFNLLNKEQDEKNINNSSYLLSFTSFIIETIENDIKCMMMSEHTWKDDVEKIYNIKFY